MRLTGSALAVLPSCRYYARPDVTWPENEVGIAADFGNANHELADAYVKDRPLGVADVAKTHNLNAEQIERLHVTWGHLRTWIDAHRKPNWMTEVAYAWDYKTDQARLLPTKFHRDYSARTNDEIAATLDIVEFDAPDATLYDYKTGHSGPGHYNWQMRFGAIAIARALGVRTARSVLVYVDEAGVHEFEQIYDEIDIDADARQLAGWCEEAETGKPEPLPGTQCARDYCPIRATCPATQEAIATVARMPLVDVQRLVNDGIRTPIDAGRAYQQIRVIKEAVKAIEKRVTEVVDQQGYAPLLGGGVLRMSETVRETFSRKRLPPDREHEILQELREVGALVLSKSRYPKEYKR